MPQARRRFGPLFRVTAVAAIIVGASVPFWPKAQEGWTAWLLSRRLRDPAEAVRRKAAEQLVQLGSPATSWVIAAMRDSNPSVRRLACSILPRTGPEPPDGAVAALLAAGRDSEASVRAAAVEQLAAFASGGPLRTSDRSRQLALQGICTALDDSSSAVREAAGWTLYNLGSQAKPAANDLYRALNGPDRTLRVLAAMTLLKLSPNDARQRVAAAMTSLVVDDSGSIDDWRAEFNHQRALITLKAAAGEEQLASVLAPWLKRQDATRRHRAMADLTSHCPDAKILTPCFKEAMASTDGMIRCDAALFLVAHRPELASEALDLLVGEIVKPVHGTYYFSHLVDQLKKGSASSLSRFARSLADALPKTTGAERTVYVIMALGQIGPEAKTAVPALLEATNSGDRLVAVRAIESLTKIDPKSAATKLPALLDLMHSRNETPVRLVALAAIRDLGPAAATTVPALLKAVDEEDLAISTAAIEALSKIDPPAAAAIKQGIVSGQLRWRED